MSKVILCLPAFELSPLEAFCWVNEFTFIDSVHELPGCGFFELHE
jgi:hypothetical protein